MKRIKIFCCSILLFGVSCDKDKTPIPVEISESGNCSPDSVYYINSIQPLLASNCAKSGCHDALTNQEGFDLGTYSGTLEALDDKLIQVITDDNPEDRMPPAGNTPLTADQVSLIQKWVSQGAKNNSCTEGATGVSCITTAMSYANNISSIISANCLGCHSGSSPSGGLNFSGYTGLAAAASTGKLYAAVSKNGNATPMPPTGKLSSCDIARIKSWVDAGAPNN